MLKRLAFAAPLLALATPALTQTAQEIVKGVYVGATDICDDIRSQSLQSVMEAGNTILTGSGFESVEFNCAFLQGLKNQRMPAGWVVTAMCEEPGYAYPEMFSVVERTPGELEVAAMSEIRGAYTLPDNDGEAAPDNPDQQQSEADDAAGPQSPPNAQAQDRDEQENDEESYGLSGVWYRCDGVTAP